jgi:hypothetical protein
MGSYVFHNPSCPLNVGIPLSLEIPAPVRNTKCSDLDNVDLSSLMESSKFLDIGWIVHIVYSC